MRILIGLSKKSLDRLVPAEKKQKPPRGSGAEAFCIPNEIRCSIVLLFC